MRTKKTVFLCFIMVLALVLPLTACSKKKKADPDILDLNNKPKVEDAWVNYSRICARGVLYIGFSNTMLSRMNYRLQGDMNSDTAKEYELTAYLYPSSDAAVLKRSEAIAKVTCCPSLVTDEEAETKYWGYDFRVFLPANCQEGSYMIVVAREDGTVESVLEATAEPVPSEPILIDKPVIYLYPEEETDVSVKMDIKGEILCTYPAYVEGWNVTAYPDGKLFDKGTGRYYDYLFWEASTPFITDSFDKAACVAAEDTAAFLEEYLTASGLNDSEIDDFISFWLPRMQGSAYNLISFPNEEYKAWAGIIVNPAPKTEIRLFMVYKPLDEAIEIPEDRKLTLPETPERDGFTVVEWGGSMLENHLG